MNLVSVLTAALRDGSMERRRLGATAIANLTCSRKGFEAFLKEEMIRRLILCVLPPHSEECVEQAFLCIWNIASGRGKPRTMTHDAGVHKHLAPLLVSTFGRTAEYASGYMRSQLDAGGLNPGSEKEKIIHARQRELLAEKGLLSGLLRNLGPTWPVAAEEAAAAIWNVCYTQPHRKIVDAGAIPLLTAMARRID